MDNSQAVKEVNKLLSDDIGTLPDEPEDDNCLTIILSALENWPGQNSVTFAAACAAFFHFRRLHRKRDAVSVLSGDYFFSRFLNFLIELNSDKLMESFSEIMEGDLSDLNLIDSEFVRACARRCIQEG